MAQSSCPISPRPIDECRAGLAASKGKVRSELERKQKDPNADADLSHFDALAAGLAALKAAVEDYNKEVSAFAEKAKQYVANLPKSDVASIRVALSKEQEIKKRFTPEWKKWATDYPAAKKDADALQTQKNAKQKELEDYSKTIFDTYQKRINELLYNAWNGLHYHWLDREDGRTGKRELQRFRVSHLAADGPTDNPAR